MSASQIEREEDYLEIGEDYLDNSGGIPPTRDEWRALAKADPELPSVDQIVVVFGSWGDFLEELGAEPHIS